jgi:hypothetical protein
MPKNHTRNWQNAEKEAAVLVEAWKKCRDHQKSEESAAIQAQERSQPRLR